MSLAFFNVNFRFQSNVCDGCHDLLQKAMSFKEVAGFSVKGNTYRSFGAWVDEVINTMKKFNLSKEKSNSI